MFGKHQEIRADAYDQIGKFVDVEVDRSCAAHGPIGKLSFSWKWTVSKLGIGGEEPMFSKYQRNFSLSGALESPPILFICMSATNEVTIAVAVQSTDVGSAIHETSSCSLPSAWSGPRNLSVRHHLSAATMFRSTTCAGNVSAREQVEVAVAVPVGDVGTRIVVIGVDMIVWIFRYRGRWVPKSLPSA